MTVEIARRRLIAKPWGARDLGQWDTGADDGSRVGEIWYERNDGDAATGSLLLKLLFTTEQLRDVGARARALPPEAPSSDVARR